MSVLTVVSNASGFIFKCMYIDLCIGPTCELFDELYILICDIGNILGLCSTRYIYNVFKCLMPRSHINRAPYDFPYPAACRGFRDRTGTVRFSFLRHVCMVTYSAAPGENWSGEMKGARKGAGRVPTGCRSVTLRGSVR